MLLEPASSLAATVPRDGGSVAEWGYRARASAGSDPLRGKRHDLTEIVPARPRTAAEAEKARTRLLSHVDEQSNPRTKETVNQLLARYLAVVELEEFTRKTYVGYLDVHVRPMLGALPLSKLNGEVLDTFYAELRRCRVHCDRRRRGVDHRTNTEHECDGRCTPHVCRPLAASTVRQIH